MCDPTSEVELPVEMKNTQEARQYMMERSGGTTRYAMCRDLSLADAAKVPMAYFSRW